MGASGAGTTGGYQVWSVSARYEARGAPEPRLTGSHVLSTGRRAPGVSRRVRSRGPAGRGRPSATSGRRAPRYRQTMAGVFLTLSDQQERDLDPEAREILDDLRLLLVATGGMSPDRSLAAPEGRHLRLRLIRGPFDWVEVLVGDGYTEFTASDEKTFKGYLVPREVVDRVRRWLLEGARGAVDPSPSGPVVRALDDWAARRCGWTRGRYRFRTWVRTKLPFALLSLSPPGAGDCGRHQWHNVDGVVERCYHCGALQPTRPEWRR